MDPGPLQELKAASQKEVKQIGCMAGLAHIVLRKGKCAFSLAAGWANKKARARFNFRTLCRLHGCTKPIVATALLTLVDKGLVHLTDPISKYIALKEEVAVSGSSRSSKPVKIVPTIRHLLTMTAGVKYDVCPAYASVMKRVKKGEIMDLKGLCDGLATVPLQFQPGTRYEYSFCTDLIGRVCEIVSGQKLDVFLRQSLLKPLGMKDTHFIVPPSKRKRTSLLYDCQPVKRSGTKSGPQVYEAIPWDHHLSAPGIMSGGGGVLSYKDAGLYSTITDYVQFLSMLANNGVAPGGARVLKETTVQSFWKDSLTPYGKSDGRLPGWHDASGKQKGGYWDYTGWSLINTHLTFSQGVQRGVCRRGSTMWMGGGGGTFWVIHPKRELVSVSFSQTFGGRSDEEDGLGPRSSDAAPFASAAVDAGAKRQRRG